MRFCRATARRAPAVPAGSAPLEMLSINGARPAVHGKFIYVGNQKFIARGVTYGPFRPDELDCAYHNRKIVGQDFAAMAAHGINAVRTYTCPPRWLLDLAAEQGLRVMVGVGLAGEQLSAFLDDRKTIRTIRRRCADEVRACACHPALLSYSIGNEIPATIVRWHGRRRVERFLHDLCSIAHDQDPDGLVTYVNYPTTEYLRLPFLDFLSYNVYLESPDRLDAYLARLQNIADYRPLMMAEIGLDTLRNGVDAQAQSLNQQIRTSYAAGCAGVFVFSWTDEWHTGGADVENWKFGITDAERRPKPALQSVRKAFADAPLPPKPGLAKISVVVCTHNGSRTISDCLEGCARLDYPDYEVIVIDDGSTDATAEIARRFDVRLIRTPNRGLSAARNLGLSAASGEIIAYLDDDARPEEHWLSFLAHAFATSDHVGIGGPNIVPVEDPPLSHCVANAPGGPTHVLVTDRLAEHIPGCNMAFRTARLCDIGGFDTQFRIAGDDVDVCWRLQQRGWTLGFHPGAIVWHHRRRSLKAYVKQQREYGRAEAMLETKWPEKYNPIGHIRWRGRLYGVGACRRIGLWPSRIYHGVWGTGAFQPLCDEESFLSALPLAAEWYLLIVALLGIGALGLLWPPLLLCLPLAMLGAAATTVQAIRCASRASFPGTKASQGFVLHCITASLHMIQPAARLYGRLSHGLTPWRRRAPRRILLPRIRTRQIWSETWQPAEQRLKAVESHIQDLRLPVQRGGAYDGWDLEIGGGFFASVRIRMGIEEYPGGRQYIRFRAWPCFCMPAAMLVPLIAGLATGAAVQHASAAGTILFCLVATLMLRALGNCSTAMSGALAALDRYNHLVNVVPDITVVPIQLPESAVGLTGAAKGEPVFGCDLPLDPLPGETGKRKGREELGDDRDVIAAEAAKFVPGEPSCTK